jgi:hypothetical protein
MFDRGETFASHNLKNVGLTFGGRAEHGLSIPPKVSFEHPRSKFLFHMLSYYVHMNTIIATPMNVA